MDITVKDYNIKRQSRVSDCNTSEKNWSFWFLLSWLLKLMKIIQIKMKKKKYKYEAGRNVAEMVKDDMQLQVF